MKQMLKDYGIEQGTMNLYCDNSSVVNISKNLVIYYHTKHIEIRHHFIQDLVEDKVVSLKFELQNIDWQISLPSLWILLGLNSLGNP